MASLTFPAPCWLAVGARSRRSTCHTAFLPTVRLRPSSTLAGLHALFTAKLKAPGWSRMLRQKCPSHSGVWFFPEFLGQEATVQPLPRSTL